MSNYTKTEYSSKSRAAIERLYIALHAMGFAHSVEIWDSGKLMGGLYGVKIGGAFFGESMFSRASNTSKIALAHLMGRLHYCGFGLLDAQFTNDHLLQFGLLEIDKEEFQIILQSALQDRCDLRLDIAEEEIITHLSHLNKVTS